MAAPRKRAPEKPHESPMIIASAEPNTDAAPFTPHSKALWFWSPSVLRLLTARGKGHPMRIPSGRTTSMAARRGSMPISNARGKTKTRIASSPATHMDRGCRDAPLEAGEQRGQDTADATAEEK